jgi:hypothetical protein
MPWRGNASRRRFAAFWGVFWGFWYLDKGSGRKALETPVILFGEAMKEINKWFALDAVINKGEKREVVCAQFEMSMSTLKRLLAQVKSDYPDDFAKVVEREVEKLQDPNQKTTSSLIVRAGHKLPPSFRFSPGTAIWRDRITGDYGVQDLGSWDLVKIEAKPLKRAEIEALLKRTEAD